MLNVVLHIGMPKTGSSFLQEWLVANSESAPNLPMVKGAHRLAIECCDQERFPGREDFATNSDHISMDQVADALASLKARNPKRIVISSEYFHLARPHDIRDKFDELGLRVEKIICLVRRQDRMIASGYAQDIKALGREEPLVFSPGGYTEWYDWLKIMRDFDIAFPLAKFVPLEFDHLRETNGLLPRWKKEIGCAEETRDAEISRRNINPSLPGDLVEVCRVGNAYGMDLNDFALKAAKEGVLTSQYVLPRDLQEIVRRGFAHLNDKFVAELDDPTGFEDYTSEQWVVSDGSPKAPTVAAVARLLDFAISEGK